MRNLQEATERICELKGGLVALDALLPAVIDTLSSAGLSRLTASFDAHAEVARTLMLNSEMSDVVIAAFEREVARNSALLRRGQLQAPTVAVPPSLDPLLLTTTRVSAFVGTTQLCRNTGFFFRRGGQLFLVSTRQALVGHQETPPPDRIDIQLPADAQGGTSHTLSFPTLASGGHRRCRGVADVDVAVMALDPAELPASAMLLAFDESHLEPLGESVGVGDPVSTVCLSLGDSAHARHVPLARKGAIASSYGLRFEDTASFLTDMHSHPESYGSALVRRRTVGRTGKGLEGWQLIGIHSHDAVASRDGASSALHRAWYADILMSISEGC
jgi:hypothetical protein